jgi:hypothetical protein
MSPLLAVVVPLLVPLMLVWPPTAVSHNAIVDLASTGLGLLRVVEIEGVGDPVDDVLEGRLALAGLEELSRRVDIGEELFRGGEVGCEPFAERGVEVPQLPRVGKRSPLSPIGTSVTVFHAPLDF